MNDRTLNLLRHVVGPIAVAAISGYAAVRVAREQTRMSYEALAPAVRELQDSVAKLSGRVEELSRESRVVVMRAESRPTASPVRLPAVSVEVERAPAPPEQKQMKRPAEKFDDMMKGL